MVAECLRLARICLSIQSASVSALLEHLQEISPRHASAVDTEIHDLAFMAADVFHGPAQLLTQLDDHARRKLELKKQMHQRLLFGLGGFSSWAVFPQMGQQNFILFLQGGHALGDFLRIRARVDAFSRAFFILLGGFRIGFQFRRNLGGFRHRRLALELGRIDEIYNQIRHARFGVNDPRMLAQNIGGRCGKAGQGF